MRMWLLIHNMLNIIMSIVVWFQYDDFSFVCVQVFSSAKYPAPDHLQDYSSIFIEATDPSSQTRPRHRIQNKLRPFDDKSLQVRWTHHSCNRVRVFFFFWLEMNPIKREWKARLVQVKCSQTDVIKVKWHQSCYRDKSQGGVQTARSCRCACYKCYS